jgi:mono/diheme cytochrome c family protein
VWSRARVVMLLIAGASSVAGAASGARGLAQEPAGQPGAPAGAPVAGRTAGESKGTAANGKTLFVKYGCYECHGYVGQGGGGPRLAPQPMALAAMTQIVRHPPNQMPPYTAKVLSDQELADIHAYLSSIPKPPDPSSIPLLQEK